MGRTLAALAVLFLLLRVVTVAAYRDTLYCYGLVSHQFSIAEAAYKGHGFTYDAVLTENASKEANRSGRHIPLEEWARLGGSGEYTAYPAADLPGLGYLIAATSRWFGDRLTTRYAMAIQVSVEPREPAALRGLRRVRLRAASGASGRSRLRARLPLHMAAGEQADAGRVPGRLLRLLRRRDRRVREKRRGPLLRAAGAVPRRRLPAAVGAAARVLLRCLRAAPGRAPPRPLPSREEHLRGNGGPHPLARVRLPAAAVQPETLRCRRHLRPRRNALGEDAGDREGQPLRVRRERRGTAALGTAPLRQARGVPFAGDEPAALRSRDTGHPGRSRLLSQERRPDVPGHGQDSPRLRPAIPARGVLELRACHRAHTPEPTRFPSLSRSSTGSCWRASSTVGCC